MNKTRADGRSTNDRAFLWEEDRLAAVRRYDILGTPPHGGLDRVTALAARALDAPIALVSIVDHHRIRFASHHGLAQSEISRDPGFCASAIQQDGPWIITDASGDARSLANPLVVGEPRVRFYAGMPLTMGTGHNLGTVCVLDTRPRGITDAQVATLQDLAALVVNELELRLVAHRTVSLENELRQQAQHLAYAVQQIALPDRLPTAAGLEIDAAYLPAATARVGGDWYDAFEFDDATVAVTIGDVSGHGLNAATAMGQIRAAIRAYAHQGHEPAALLQELDSLVQHFANGHFATLAHFVIDRHTGSFRAANAGQPPPVVINDGNARLLDWPPAPPIGTGLAHRYEPLAGVLEPEDCLLLYTDGLVERRGETIDEGIARLVSIVEASPAREVLKAALSLTEDQQLDDDVAALVVRRA